MPTCSTKLERDIQIVVVAHLDDEQCIEPVQSKPSERRIRLTDAMKANTALCPPDDHDSESEFLDGFRMKCLFIQSPHMLSFTKEKDRLIEITEAQRHQAHIDVYKHYPIDSFDLYIISAHIAYKSMTLNDWWNAYRTLMTTPSADAHDKQIQMLCAPAFKLPLPKQLVCQSRCLIRFYEMFKSTLFSVYRRSSSSSLLSSVIHVLPVLQLSFRPDILQWFDARIEKHKRLGKLRTVNCLCFVAKGSKKTSFQYDFTLMEFQIVRQFNASERQLNTLVKKFATKHLRCALDNTFLLTSVLWVCEEHELANYHHVFEVWVSFMRDACRTRHLSHYFLENVNIYEKHYGLEELLQTIDYRNIDAFIGQLDQNLIVPYVHQYNDRMNLLMDFIRSQPTLAVRMRPVFNVYVKTQFPRADGSLHEMCSILCHLSFLEDDEQENPISFWHQQWKPIFIDVDCDDIVLRHTPIDVRPDVFAQQMTASVFKLIQSDFLQMIDSTRFKAASGESLLDEDK